MNKKLIIIASAVIVLLGGAGAGVWFFTADILPEFIKPKGATRGKETAKREEPKKHEPEVGADLEVFVVNLTGSIPSRYLRTSLSLGVKDEREKEKIRESSGPIRHAVIMYLTEKTVEDLIDPQGKNKLRADLLKRINTAIGKPLVLNVYFKEFLIQ
ncbi:MAG: flagellar basal body-associated FliL family protein [Deltaproteobacteria bacterium]|nr:flagellar basal body-associated FliL family protein [Deltaproteobacteria bacterium]MBI2182918.1 flagellar basal body-associated FliL family protein [Deltaproteobacteria bacterium]MBI2229446.1 flagellar basal body-associated FliL family protein [Deltaproteobacteria bacterium]MBI2363910.1 flagellar basal body-associated FliL family protein [Deltaproteobacteria bacterium]MBI2534385.1 flagellar basal body-associated FliL family protein [Deltaproteobacteria bacterium]